MDIKELNCLLGTNNNGSYELNNLIQIVCKSKTGNINNIGIFFARYVLERIPNLDNVNFFDAYYLNLYYSGNMVESYNVLMKIIENLNIGEDSKRILSNHQFSFSKMKEIQNEKINIKSIPNISYLTNLNPNFKLKLDNFTKNDTIFVYEILHDAISLFNNIFFIKSNINGIIIVDKFDKMNTPEFQNNSKNTYEFIKNNNLKIVNSINEVNNIIINNEDDNSEGYIFYSNDEWKFCIEKDYVSFGKQIINLCGLEQVFVNVGHAKNETDIRIDNIQYIHYKDQNNVNKSFNYYENKRRNNISYNQPSLFKITTENITNKDIKSGYMPSIYCYSDYQIQIPEEKNNGRLLVKPVCAFFNSSSEMKMCLDRQAKTDELGDKYWDNFELTTSNNPDYYVVFHDPGSIKIDPKKTIYLQTEPQVPNHINLNDYLLSVTLDKSHYLGDWHAGRNFKDLEDDLKFYEQNGINRLQKTKMLSTVISSNYFFPGHKKRIDFMRYCDNKNMDIDFYGRENKFGFKNYLGALPAHDKSIGLNDYKYTFNAENYQINNYVTEKMHDSILAECLCFYWGCPNISDIIDSRAYILIDLDDFEKSYQIILDAIKNNEWEKRLPYIMESKRKIMYELQFCPQISKILNKKMYNIYISKRSNVHVFVEIAAMLKKDLEDKGYLCTIQNNLDLNKTNIIFGIHLEQNLAYPDDTIVFNMEQLYDGSPWLSRGYLNILLKYKVWDYCNSNIKYLKDKLNVSSELFNYGFVDEYDNQCFNIDWNNKPVDVLCFGSAISRRNNIIDTLKKMGIKAEFHCDLWGTQRLEKIKQTKIYLNIHYHETGLIEIPRLSYLLNSGVFIISEVSKNNEDFPYIKDCVVYSEYDNLINTISHYLKNPQESNLIAQKGYNIFKNIKPSFSFI